MLEIISDGQKEVLNQFSSRMEMLKLSFEKLKTLLPDLDQDESGMLYIYLQSKLFTGSSTDGITDSELQKISKQNGNVSRRKFKDMVDKFTEQGVLITVKKNPIQHVLNDDFYK